MQIEDKCLDCPYCYVDDLFYEVMCKKGECVEEWVDIPGFSKYEVSSLGRIRNKKRNKLITPYKINSGYWCVGLYKDNKRKFFLVHRLVAMAFLPNPLGLPQVDHIDRDIDNNTLANLRWITEEENRKSQKHKGFKCKRTPIAQYDRDGNLVAVYPTQKEAARETGISIQMINRVVNEKRQSTHGFEFRRVEVNEDERIK